MILFENKENAQLIRQYLNQDILFEDCSIALDAFPAYERFDGEFHLLMLEIARTIMSATLSEERKLRFNRKLLAERIMQLYALRINHKDPEIILIYNRTNGRWEDGKIAVSRLIIEIAHYLGDNGVDSWTANLERSVIDILLRKVEMIDPFVRLYIKIISGSLWFILSTPMI